MYYWAAVVGKTLLRDPHVGSGHAAAAWAIALAPGQF